MKLLQVQKEQADKLIKDVLEMDLTYFLETSDAEDIDELTDYLQEQGAFDIEIIYHHKAMDYLMENDTSLAYSIEIADEMGYETKSINSELLASLLASQNEREEYDRIVNELEEILFPE